MKTRIIIINLIVITIIILNILLFFGYQKQKKPNPVIVELQKQITEQVGPEFQISEEYYEGREPLDSLIIQGDDEQFKDSKIFIKVNKIREIVYDYVNDNKNDFELAMNRPSTNGFLLYIGDTIDYNIFTFTNYIENEEIFSDKWVSLRCYARDTRSELRFYGYKCSQLKVLKNVKELQAYYFEIDNVKVLGEIEGLEYFFANIEGAKNEEDYEDLKNAVEMQGIQFVVW